MNGGYVYSALRDASMPGGNARRNLATFCQTRQRPEIHQLMGDPVVKDMIDKNMIDEDEPPQVAEIGMRGVRMLANLRNAP